MMGYNMLARKTAHSQHFFRGIDAFSGVITIWTLANIVVVAISLHAHSSPPVSIEHGLTVVCISY
jgi:hypothetical protein